MTEDWEPDEACKGTAWSSKHFRNDLGMGVLKLVGADSASAYSAPSQCCLAAQARPRPCGPNLAAPSASSKTETEAETENKQNEQNKQNVPNKQNEPQTEKEPH